MHKFAGIAVEDDFALVQDEKSRRLVDAVIGNLFHLVVLLVKPIARDDEGILQPVRDHQRRRMGDVALFDN